MEIPAEYLETFSVFYQAVKQMAVELVMECHDPDYQATLENVRQRVSEAEERIFQLSLFGDEGIVPRAGKAAV